MDKVVVAGYEWVRLNDICDILRHVKEDRIFDQAEKIVDQIAHLMFFDELKAAKTKEEREAALELPGEFVVYKTIRKEGSKKSVVFFQEWKNKKPVFGDGYHAMRFKYDGTAKQVAKKIGPEWHSMCIGIEDGRIARRFLDAINDAIDAKSDIETEEK